MMVDFTYSNLLEDILENGTEINSRNSKTIRKRNLMATFYCTPLVSVRRTAWKNALREMQWFLSGSNNIKDLHPNVKKWWEPWADEDGWIHNNYGKQFRRFEGSGFNGPIKYHHTVDQIQYMIDTLNNSPFSRRNVITTWHTHDMMSPHTPITNCHGTVIQAFVEEECLHLTMYQRSADMMLGVPHNWIQYWALLLYLMNQSNKSLGSLTWIGGDCHIYKDHIEAAKEIIEKTNRLSKHNKLPKTPDLIYSQSPEFKSDDFTLNSQYEPIIKKSLKMVV